jgi:hypothetical protein
MYQSICPERIRNISNEANHDAASGQPAPDNKIFTDDELISMIDPILLQDDRNADGFIDYAEFQIAQQNAAAAAQQS